VFRNTKQIFRIGTEAQIKFK